MEAKRKKRSWILIVLDVLVHVITPLSSVFISSASIIAFFTLTGSTPWEFLADVLTRYIFVPIYLVLCVVGAFSAFVAAKGLYSASATEKKTRILAHVGASVLAFILGFGVLYFDLSSDKSHFGTDARLSPMSAIYFSIVTFATVGYGDIAPRSDVARFWVSIEIIGGLCYTILIFSVIAGFIRQGNDRPTASGT